MASHLFYLPLSKKRSNIALINGMSTLLRASPRFNSLHWSRCWKYTSVVQKHLDFWNNYIRFLSSILAKKFSTLSRLIFYGFLVVKTTPQKSGFWKKKSWFYFICMPVADSLIGREWSFFPLSYNNVSGLGVRSAIRLHWQASYLTPHL